MSGSETTTSSMVKRLVGTYLRPYGGKILLALVFMVIAAVMTVAFAKLLEPVVDLVLVGKKAHLVGPMAGVLFGVFFISGLATYGHTVLMNTTGESIVADIQQDLFSRFMDMDLAFFHERPSGHLVSRVTGDVTAIRSAASDSLTGIGKSFLTLLFLVVLMFSQDATLALIAIAVFPPAALFVGWAGRRIRKIARSTRDETASLSGNMVQIFQGMRQVKAAGTEDHERARTAEAIGRVRRLLFKSIRVGSLSAPINETLIGAALAGVILYGGGRVIDGHMTAGELMSFIGAFSLAYEPLKRLAKLNNNLQRGLGAAERIFGLLDEVPSITDRPGAAALKTEKPDIIFDGVEFSYGDEEEVALHDVSFTAAAGKVTALVGPSGGGKSTALNLVPRLYDVTAGKVLIDGQDVRDVTMESLRSHIALVSQDVTVFDDTVRANIAYGKPDATNEEIEQVARDAAADAFIRELPEGYDTVLGEHGMRLSGGQRQRIAIARAMLRDAPVLLLDEATSALDTESERAIQESLERLEEGRTTLVIAHRLSTVQNADRIVVLDGGRVVEQGNHKELMKADGLYARLYRGGGL